MNTGNTPPYTPSIPPNTDYSRKRQRTAPPSNVPMPPSQPHPHSSTLRQSLFGLISSTPSYSSRFENFLLGKSNPRAAKVKRIFTRFKANNIPFGGYPIEHFTKPTVKSVPFVQLNLVSEGEDFKDAYELPANPQNLFYGYRNDQVLIYVFVQNGHIPSALSMGISMQNALVQYTKSTEIFGETSCVNILNRSSAVEDGYFAVFKAEKSLMEKLYSFKMALGGGEALFPNRLETLQSTALGQEAEFILRQIRSFIQLSLNNNFDLDLNIGNFYMEGEQVLLANFPTSIEHTPPFRSAKMRTLFDYLKNDLSYVFPKDFVSDYFIEIEAQLDTNSYFAQIN